MPANLLQRLFARLGWKRDRGLFRPWSFPITREMENEIRARVAERGSTPTADQWRMIFARSPCTSVNAGAGSGKSTTLILRVLVMHKYLGIPLECITVFSFTRKSTEEFREKLRNLFKAHGIELSKLQVKNLVSTFHSKVLKFAQFKGGQQLFDFLQSSIDLAREVPAGGEGAGGEAGTTALPEEPDLLGLPDLKQSVAQLAYLRKAYERCWSNSPAFRSRILPLYRHYLRKLDHQPKPNEHYQAWAVQRAAEEDVAVAASVQSIFRGGSEAPVPFQLRHLETNLVFQANLYVQELDTYVVYVPEPKLLGPRADERVGNLPLHKWLVFKARILARYAAGRVRFVTTQEALDCILEEARITEAVERGQPPVPIFDYKLQGEIRAKPIWAALYDTGAFTESMGLTPKQVASRAGSLDQLERGFIEALVLYWNELDRLLAEDHLVRFASLFAKYSERNPAALEATPNAILDSMTHVLIDEFQDVSPEVVGWIRGVLRRLQQLGNETSLLCVGDDYQSIYGWRGSSPQFFLQFAKEFPSRNHESIQMTENFRSRQEIIDHAERILQSIPVGIDRTDKHGRAMTHDTAPDRSQVVRFVADEDLARIRDEVARFANRWREANHHVKGTPKSESERPILVLTRSNEQRGRVGKALQRRDAQLVRLMTYHSSKGLEAPYCVLMGDCYYDNRFPVRNLIYKVAGFQSSYDVAQRQEALRLGYVALTRAALECVWFASPDGGGAFARARGESS